MIDLAAVLAPLNPIEHAGWRTFGANQPLDAKGIVLHHTASSVKSGPIGSLGVVMGGRPGVPPRLCNILLGRDGSVHLICANKANHAGRDSSKALQEMGQGLVSVKTKSAKARGLTDDTVGNREAYGIEMENDGVKEPWPDIQVDAAGHMCALICKAHGWAAGHVSLHRLITSRKTDPWGAVDWWGKTMKHLAAL